MSNRQGLYLLCGAVVLIGALALAGSTSWQPSNQPRPPVPPLPPSGDLAPPLQAAGWINTGNRPVVLADLRGHVVLLDFWATWCGPCRASLPAVQALSAAYARDGLVVVGVHVSSGGDKMAEFAVTNNLTYPLCVDANDATRKAYKVTGIPHLVLLGKDGRIRDANLALKTASETIKQALAER